MCHVCKTLLSLLALEPFGEFSYSLGPVADLVFYLFSELRETLVITVGYEYWVVAEAFGTMFFMGYSAFHGALESVFA